MYQIYKVRRYGQRNTGAAQESKLELARYARIPVLRVQTPLFFSCAMVVQKFINFMTDSTIFIAIHQDFLFQNFTFSVFCHIIFKHFVKILLIKHLCYVVYKNKLNLICDQILYLNITFCNWNVYD